MQEYPIAFFCRVNNSVLKAIFSLGVIELVYYLLLLKQFKPSFNIILKFFKILLS